MHKIGEIWVDDGSGCMVWIALILIMIPISIVVGIIMGGIWVYNAGSNLVNYGTIDTETAHVRAIATAVALETQATAIALAPVEADAKYYTHLVERAKISVGAVSNFDYDANLDSIYFNIDFTNGDDRPHTIDVVFQGRLAKKYEGSLLHAPSPFERRISLQPGHSSQKIVEPPGPCYCAKFLSRVGGMSLSVSDLHVDLKLIDGFPLQDPRESLSKLTSEFSRGEQPGQCFLKVTNNDIVPHSLAGYVDFNYTYTELGVIKQKSGSTKNDSFNDINVTTINPGKSVALRHYDGLGILPRFPANLSSVIVKRVVLELLDPGTESIHPSVRTKTFTPYDVCNYKK